MSYDDGYEKTEIDASLLSEAQVLIIKGFALDGEFKFREQLIEVLTEEMSTQSGDHAEDWRDGLSYCIHLARNLPPSQN